MPATVTDDPLTISCVFSDGSTAGSGSTSLPCRQLVRDLADRLVELIDPHGCCEAARVGGCTTSSPIRHLRLARSSDVGDSLVGHRDLHLGR